MEISGVFREESPALFLNLMCKLGRAYYNDIETKVLKKYRSRSERHFLPTLVQCLSDVNMWSPRIKHEFLENILKKNPSLPQLYESTYVGILKNFAHNITTSFQEYNIPTFDDFFLLFLMKLADNPFVLQGDLCKSAEISCTVVMSILRDSFIECIQFVSMKDVPITEANLTVNDQIARMKLKEKETKEYAKSQKSGGSRDRVEDINETLSKASTKTSRSSKTQSSASSSSSSKGTSSHKTEKEDKHHKKHHTKEEESKPKSPKRKSKPVAPQPIILALPPLAPPVVPPAAPQPAVILEAKTTPAVPQAVPSR
jgi:hypothetical protein